MVSRVIRRLRLLLLALTMKPIRGAAPEGDDAGGDGKTGDEGDKPPDDGGKTGDAEGGDSGSGDDGDGSGGESGKDETDWKAMSRKHEREEKKARKALAEAEAKLADRENADKSEQEKAIEAARQEGEKAATDKADAARRQDRLEVGVTRLAAKTFADTEDALLHVKRGLESGDIDADEVFDSEGKVQTEALQKALRDILEDKPHLAASTDGRPAGGADGGKGGGGGKDLESMSPDDHLEQIRKNRQH